MDHERIEVTNAENDRTQSPPRPEAGPGNTYAPWQTGPQCADRRIEQPEIDEVMAALAGLSLYNGITGVELRKRYGERLYHVMGDGWYVKADQLREGRV